MCYGLSHPPGPSAGRPPVRGMSHSSPGRRSSIRRRRRLVVEALEHRLQPSAAFTDLPAPAQFTATVAGPLPLTIVDVPTFPGTTTVGTTRTVVAAPAGASASVVIGAARHELYLVAFDVPDRDALVRDLLARPGFSGEVVELAGVGLAEVTAALRDRAGLDAVHLLTHGAAGSITLGPDVLDATTLPGYAADLRVWGAALAPGGDLLLYGCDVAADGGTFVTILSTQTGADVSASTDRTGAAEHGGNWVLEYATGAIESTPFDASGWAHTLPTATFRQGSGGYAGIKDTYLDIDNPTDPHGDEDNLFAEGGSENLQGLLRFDGIIGTGPGQIPPGATITSASLEVFVTNTADRTLVRFHRMLVPWAESSSWASLGNGVQLNGLEAVAAADASYGGTGSDKEQTVSGLAAAVQAWADGAPNYGWVIVSSNDKWGFHASEKNNYNAPQFVVTYTTGNQTPVAAADARSTTEDTLVVVGAAGGVLANDSDPDGDTLVVTGYTQPSRGTVVVNADGSFTFTPAANAAGPEGFTYIASDGRGGNATGTVSLTIQPMNDAPVARDDSYTTAVNLVVLSTPLVVGTPGVLANDSDPDGDLLTAQLVTGPAGGLLTFRPDGSFTYTAVLNFSGADSFTYRVTDGTAWSAPATVMVNVSSPNRTPAAQPESYATAEDTPLTVATPGLLGNDTDPDGDTLAVVVDSGPARGTLTLRAGGGFTYTPAADWSGTDSFTYHATDGSRDSAPVQVTLTVTAVDDPPTLDALADLTISEDGGPVTVNLAGISAGDGERQALTVSAVRSDPTLLTQPTGFFDPVSGVGTLVLRPVADANGTATVTLVVDDGTSTVTRTFAVTVTPVNDPPTAADDSFVTTRNTPLTVTAAGVLGNDTDIDGDALAAVLVAGPTNGTLTLNSDGSFAYTPDAGFVGLDSFTYQAADAGGETSTATAGILVRPTNRAPTGTADVVATAAGKPVVLTVADVLANDADPDGDPMTAALVDGATNGTVSMAADGSFTYTPAAGFSGTDTFTYRVTDGQLESGLVQVTVTVSAPTSPEPPPTDPPTPNPSPPTTATPPTGTPAPTAGTPPVAAPPTAGPPAVSFAPSASGSYDGYSPSGGGPAGTVSPAPAVSSGGATPSPRSDAPTPFDAGRVYAPGEAPAAAAPVPVEVAPPPASVPPQPTPAPSDPPPPIVILPPPQPAALPAAPPVASTVTNVVEPDQLLEPLDRVRDELRAEAAERATTDTIVVAGGVAVAGTVLLNTRAVYWFLSALLARPAVWRRFDPLDVVCAWERENARGGGPDDSLQSMVG